MSFGERSQAMPHRGRRAPRKPKELPPPVPDVPRSGSLRHQRDGQWIMTSPGDSLYSLAQFVATEFWNGDTWVKIAEADRESVT